MRIVAKGIDVETDELEFLTNTNNPTIGTCVEVAFTESGHAIMRDSEDRAGSHLVFTGPQWAAFEAGVLDGKFKPQS